MNTLLICTIAAIVILTLIRGIYIEYSEKDGDFALLYIWSLCIVIFLLVVGIVSINNPSKYASKEIVTPEVSVKQTIKDNKIIESDTTYTYTFKE